MKFRKVLVFESNFIVIRSDCLLTSVIAGSVGIKGLSTSDQALHWLPFQPVQPRSRPLMHYQARLTVDLALQALTSSSYPVRSAKKDGMSNVVAGEMPFSKLKGDLGTGADELSVFAAMESLRIAVVEGSAVGSLVFWKLRDGSRLIFVLKLISFAYKFSTMLAE